jgi:hypothetical protein
MLSAQAPSGLDKAGAKSPALTRRDYQIEMFEVFDIYEILQKLILPMKAKKCWLIYFFHGPRGLRVIASDS